MTATASERSARLAQKDWKNRQRNARQRGKGALALTPKQRAMSWGLRLIMALMVLYCMIPLVWLLFSTTKTTGGLYSSPGLWFADQNVFIDNVVTTLTMQNGIYVRWLLNTIGYALIAGLGSSLFAALAGYAIAVMKFPGRGWLLWVTLAFMSVPNTVITIPLFLMYTEVGLVNTPWAVILPQLSFPFGLYLMIIYAQSAVPISLVEAAKLDGAKHWQIFWKIAFPLLAPGFVTVLLFSLVTVWNNYFLPLIMLHDKNDYPLTVGLNNWLASSVQATSEAVPNNIILTGSLLAIVPLIIAFLFLQKYWQSGLSAGSVKE